MHHHQIDKNSSIHVTRRCSTSVETKFRLSILKTFKLRIFLDFKTIGRILLYYSRIRIEYLINSNQNPCHFIKMYKTFQGHLLQIRFQRKQVTAHFHRNLIDVIKSKDATMMRLRTNLMIQVMFRKV